MSQLFEPNRPMPALLRRGRRVILFRAGIASSVRWGLGGGALASILLAGQRLASRLNLDDAAPVLRGLLEPDIATATFSMAIGMGVIVGAVLGIRDATARWPRLWDRALKLPQTVESCVDLLRVDRRRVDRRRTGAGSSPWAPALLEKTPGVEIPGRSALVTLLPYRVASLVPLILMALVAQGIAASIPSAGDSPRPIDESQRSLRGLDRAILIETAELIRDANPELTASINETLASGDPRAWTRTLRQATTWLEGARLAADARRRAAFALADSPETAALAAWLTRDTLPDRLPELSTAARDAVRRAQATPGLDREAADALAAIAAGATRLDPVTDTHRNWRLAAAVVEHLRMASREAATIRDTNIARGGRDPGGKTSRRASRDGADDEDGNNDNDDDAATDLTDDTPDPKLRVSQGSRLGPGQRVESAELLPMDLKGDPDWDRILTSPRIESHWFGVVERYRRSMNTSGKNPGTDAEKKKETP